MKPTELELESKLLKIDKTGIEKLAAYYTDSSTITVEPKKVIEPKEVVVKANNFEDQLGDESFGFSDTGL